MPRQNDNQPILTQTSKNYMNAEDKIKVIEIDIGKTYSTPKHSIFNAK